MITVLQAPVTTISAIVQKVTTWTVPLELNRIKNAQHMVKLHHVSKYLVILPQYPFSG